MANDTVRLSDVDPEFAANQQLQAGGSVMAQYDPFLGGAIENPGLAGVAQSGINIAKNIGDAIPGVDVSPLEQELRNFEAQFGKDAAAAAGRIFTDMLISSTIGKLAPATTGLGNVAQGAGLGYMFGGKEGAMIGGGLSSALASVPAIRELFKRHIASSDDVLDVLKPWNLKKTLASPMTSTQTPAFKAGLEAEKRVGPLSFHQKTLVPSGIVREVEAIGPRGNLDFGVKMTGQQARNVMSAADDLSGGISGVRTPAEAGTKVVEAGTKKLSELQNQRSGVWQKAMAGTNTGARNIPLDPYRESLDDLISAKKLRISTAENEAVTRELERRLGKIVVKASEEVSPILGPKGEQIVRSIPAQNLKGTGEEVSELAKQATSSAYGGNNPFESLRTAASRRVDKLLKDSLDSVIDESARSGNPVSVGLRKARDEYAVRSMALRDFETSKVGKAIMEGKSPESVVRLILDKHSPSEVQKARKLIESVDPEAWGALQRQYVESLTGAGRVSATAPYEPFNVNAFLGRRPNRTDILAQAERDKRVMHEILRPTKANPRNISKDLNNLYSDASRVAVLKPPQVTEGSADVTRFGQAMSAPAGLVGNPTGSAPILAKYSTNWWFNPLVRKYLMTPEGQAQLMKPGLGGTPAVLGGTLASLLERSQEGNQ